MPSDSKHESAETRTHDSIAALPSQEAPPTTVHEAKNSELDVKADAIDEKQGSDVAQLPITNMTVEGLVDQTNRCA